LIYPAVYASSAIAPFLPSMEINGHILLDGAFSNPLPISEAVKHKMDVIIAVSFHERVEDKTNEYPLATWGNFWTRCAENSISAKTAQAISMHHYEIINIPVSFEENISLWSTNFIPYIFSKGREAVASKGNQILEAIRNFQS